MNTLSGVDPARIALWGDSMSAAVALAAAAFDDRVRAVIAQVPACGAQGPPDDPQRRVPGAKELLTIGGGHFGLLYHPSRHFDQVSNAQVAFLRKHL